jgi:hypothetical protein
MFEMGAFIRLRLPDGKEVEPTLVEFQRSYGMGRDRSFVMVFPKSIDGKAVKPPFEVRVKEFGQGTGTLLFPVEAVPDEMAFWRVQQMWKASATRETHP